MSQIQTQTQAERIFYSTIKADATKEHYQFYLKKYQQMYDYDSIDQLLAKSTPDIENEIIDCIMKLKDKGMKNAAISNYVKPVLKFCKVNRVNLNSDIINIHMPRRTKTKTGAYEHSQIQKLLEQADKRISCVILLLSSTGMRIGAFPSLSFGNLEETKSGLYKITIYGGEDKEICASIAHEEIEAQLLLLKTSLEYTYLKALELAQTKSDTEEIISALQMKDSARVSIVQLLSEGPEMIRKTEIQLPKNETKPYIEKYEWRENGERVSNETE
jgi:hypothetical protein